LEGTRELALRGKQKQHASLGHQFCCIGNIIQRALLEAKEQLGDKINISGGL
jgi:hypothetical protein